MIIHFSKKAFETTLDTLLRIVGLLMNDKLEIMNKEAAVICFSVLTQHLAAGTKQSLYQNSDPRSEFPSRHLPCTTPWRSVSASGLPGA
jgi:hypothetical protein